MIRLRFKQVGIIGNTKVVTSRTKNNNSTPMNSFRSSMYYFTNPNDLTRITTIAFYNNPIFHHLNATSRCHPFMQRFAIVRYV
ncbi:MAG: hypothetical protein HUJ96_04075 [Marinilabiliaceae bacterium]|nr:hypothetical protein [Marinilabiliaceae bacterium]